MSVLIARFTAKVPSVVIQVRSIVVAHDVLANLEIHSHFRCVVRHLCMQAVVSLTWIAFRPVRLNVVVGSTRRAVTSSTWRTGDCLGWLASKGRLRQDRPHLLCTAAVSLRSLARTPSSPPATPQDARVLGCRPERRSLPSPVLLLAMQPSSVEPAQTIPAHLLTSHLLSFRLASHASSSL